jgi:hypothetical protein
MKRIAVALVVLLLAACRSEPMCVDEAMCWYDATGACIPPCAAEHMQPLEETSGRH